MENSVIAPSVLLWARKVSGLSDEEVVKKIKRKQVDVKVLQEWESGKSQPNYVQLKILAGIYKRPVALFFFPEPPEEETVESDFRSLPSDVIAGIPPRMRVLLRSARARILDLQELHGNIDRIAHSIDLERRQGETAKQMAERIRTIIDIPLETQCQWTDADVALKNWRTAIEKLGIWVFKDSFKDTSEERSEYCGFCIYDKYFPVIYVNNNDVSQRQIFTLFHELSHLLLGKAGIDFRQEQDFEGVYEKDEVFCNAFASAFLLPPSELSGYKELPDDDVIKKLADTYKVSFDVILRRFLDKKLLSQAAYKEKIGQRQKNFKKTKGGSGGNYYLTQKAYLGSKYMDFVFGQYYQKRINQEKAAEYLNVKVSSIPGLESRIV